MDLTLNDALPGDSIVKTLTVENIGDKKVSYNIVWNDLINTIDNYDLHLDMKCKSYKNYNTSSQTESGSCDSFYKAVRYTKTETLDISSFDTSNVTNMGNMFMNSKATTIKGLENFNTSKVTDMNRMFANSNASSLDVSKFNTSNVINMQSMFYNTKITKINVSNFDTSKVTDMSYMFYNNEIQTLDLSSFDTNSVTNMQGMFSRDIYLKTIYIGSKFNVSNVTNSADMFNECNNLVGGSGTKFDSTKIDKTYAHIDEGTSNPGYFTAK